MSDHVSSLMFRVSGWDHQPANDSDKLETRNPEPGTLN
jgi:hypothetical protein